MLIIPAIDLIAGQCVRLKQGILGTKKTYSNDPAAMAVEWQQGGASWIHVVNLDGAFGQAGANARAITEIVDRTSCAIELGGGIRSLEDVRAWLEIGVRRVILGTAAVTNPEIAAEAVQHFGGERIVIGIDAKNERIAIRGWEEESSREVEPFVAELDAMGIQRIIYTDINRDGGDTGPNLERLEAIARSTRMRVIASGGFSRWEHFNDLLRITLNNIEGAIVGTALYEKELNLAELISRFERA
jgi:phosphoribosylformimino-5-aminoimidazole carboxamide ribotide isomerase